MLIYVYWEQADDAAALPLAHIHDGRCGGSNLLIDCGTRHSALKEGG